jgi:Cyclin D1 binding domain
MSLLLSATLTSMASGFTTLPTTYDYSSRGNQHKAPAAPLQPLHMISASFSDHWDEDNNNPHHLRDSPRKNHPNNNKNGAISKFVTGDDLHRLRHEVLAMRLELQEARRSGTMEKVRELEKTIMKSQQVDAEFVYICSMERMELAQQEGRFQDAEKYRYLAYDARAALPQFNLEGLWVGKYGEHGYEMINVTYHGDTLIAQKVTGTKNVPRGQVTFEVDLSPTLNDDSEEYLEPIELGDNAAKQWGCKYLQRFSGRGQVAAEGYLDSQWIDGQLIMVNQYFSFAWLPIGHQVFFGRPTPELILKLMKDEKRQETGNNMDRAFLEKCWEETEHLEDDHELSFAPTTQTSSLIDEVQSGSYYPQDGCFE